MKEKSRKSLLVILSMLLVFALMLFGCGAEEEETKDKKDKKDKNEEKEEEEINVSSVDELLEAIAPGAKIVLEDGVYNLTDEIDGYLYDDDFADEHEYLEVRDAYDGAELVIKNVEGLKISAENEGMAEIQVEPRYAVVLTFDGCSDIELSGLVAGHTEGEGYCTGSVIDFENCEDVSLANMDLYGCGTYGVTGSGNTGITVTESVIRDCSYGIVWISSSDDVAFDSCVMYGCEGFTQLDFYDTTAEFNSCEFYDNTFEEDEWTSFISTNENNTITFDTCTFGYNETASIYHNDFHPDTCTFYSCTFDETAYAAEPDPTYVTVYDIESFLEAMASNATITVAEGEYNITDFIDSIDVDDWNDSHDNVKIEEVYDGYTVSIYNCQNLSIIGEGETAEDVEIVTEPRYADVLGFYDCDQLHISYMTLGHTETGECAGSVIYLNGCDDASLYDLDLYGCGVYGIDMYGGSLYVYETSIHDCEYGPAWIDSVNGDVTFDNCSFTDSNGGFVLMPTDCEILFTECYFGTKEAVRILYDYCATLKDCEYDITEETVLDYYDAGDEYELDEVNVSDAAYEGYWYAYSITDSDGNVSHPDFDLDTFERNFLFVNIGWDGTGFVRGLYGEEDRLYFTYEENSSGNFVKFAADGYSLFDEAYGYIYEDEYGYLHMELTFDDDTTYSLSQIIFY